jgi:hypothetical protein
MDETMALKEKLWVTNFAGRDELLMDGSEPVYCNRLRMKSAVEGLVSVL